MKPWLRKGCLACAGLAALGFLLLCVLGVVFTLQGLAVEREPRELTRRIDPRPSDGAPPPPGRLVLSLSSAAVTLTGGPAGSPIRVESEFDPEVFLLEQSHEEQPDGSWTHRIDFHERRLLHVSVIQVWLGRRAPRVRITVPRDLRFALEARMDGGYLTFELGGMAVTSAELTLVRGVLELDADEPLQAPMERLIASGRIGTMRLRSVGNASPKLLDVTHGIGAADLHLGGAWAGDADVRFVLAFGGGALWLPDDVRVELDGEDSPPPLDAGPDELPRPTLRVHTHFDAGEIRIIE